MTIVLREVFQVDQALAYTNMLDDGLANGWGMYRLSSFANEIDFGKVSIATERSALV